MGRRLKRFSKALKLAGKAMLCCKKAPVVINTIQGDNPMGGRFLLCGINAYPSAPLSGCVNDVTDMAHKLVTECGVKEENIRLLNDARATTSAIIERCNWLTQVSPGDDVFFHYSGHGAQVPTRNDASEIDNLSEVICPVDFDWSPERMITDKQFVEIFKKIPVGAKFYWFSDSCHSGDLDKMIPRHNSPKILGIRRFPIPADIGWRQRIAKKKNLSRAMVGNILDVGFVSGCQSNQTSSDAEFGGRPNGALTYFLLKHLNMSEPLSAVTAKVVQNLDAAGFDQIPTCSGARKDLPFLS
jgi:hypothetical protein